MGLLKGLMEINGNGVTGPWRRSVNNMESFGVLMGN